MASFLFDDNGFQDVPNREPSTDLTAADDRTLRWAAPPLDAAMLDALVCYQQTYLAHASGQGTETLAQAHTEALAASGLDAKTAEQGSALLRAFGGRRWAVRKLQDKLGQLQGGAADELTGRIQDELVKKERETDALARRYGEDALVLLRAREAELVDLHTRLTHLLSRG
ncbi:hypothetical protein HV824_20955 [Myxococcus sp. AM009]|uniref:hypothetical protein n=1 Tax=unclassified Myxococcus TaxID=2648731 RepID=UPI001595BA40|nr:MULTISPECIES: hypothetical protein [unclassified Myxococcus]NVJ00567.1 hypothetical protein [Myxococcus sp. AM009]NVJ19050.1 hypothetical protein [Myxococcus sp. AM010]